MSYEPSFAWKASLRAHRRRFARPFSVLKPHWPQEPPNAASRWTVHHGWRLTITESHGSDESSRLLQPCTCWRRNHLFDSPRRIARVTKDDALAKIFRKFFTFAAANAAFQNESARYVDK